MLKKAVKYLIRRCSGYYVNVRDIKLKADRMLSEHESILNVRGFVEGTDKASMIINGSNLNQTHDYLRHYDFVFNSFRSDKFSLIEFGCFNGASLRMWEKYFPDAEIYGVDIDATTRVHEKGHVHIIIGDATSQDTRDKIKHEINSAFIILDDASHAWSDQRRSFELFWEIVEPGGFYVIEDLECGTIGAYPAYPPKVLDSQPFNEYMHDRSKILRWAPDRQPEVNSYHFQHLPEHIQKIEREMDMCIFIPGAIIVRKKHSSPELQNGL